MNNRFYFGKVALEQGMISQSQLEKVAKLFLQSQGALPLDELLLQLKFLSYDQVQYLHQLIQSRLQTQDLLTKGEIEDQLLARIAIQNRYLTKEQVKWAWQRQKQYESEGIFKRLPLVLLEDKLLPLEYIKHLLEFQRSRYLVCHRCHMQFSLKGSMANQKFQCKKCSQILEVPSSQNYIASILPETALTSTSSPHPSSLTPLPTQSQDSNLVAPPSSPSLFSSRSHSSSSHLDHSNWDKSSSSLPESETPSTPPSAGAQDLTKLKNRKFARYEIIEKIAKGGMGVVYKARDPNLNRIVALKTLIAGENASEEVIERFIIEARAAANMRHKNIVAVYDIGNYAGQYFFTMDYIEGTPYNKFIEKNSDITRHLEIMETVCEAIAYAHEQGIIHRDLKPSNIIIDKEGSPQVMDFGLAKQVDSETELTQTGATIGTPSYMPPEQAAGYLDQVDKLSDVYSLGAILYQALTKQKPFDGPTSMAIIYKVMTQEPKAPRHINPTIPQEVETIILKAMEKEKERRYLSAEEMAKDIRRYLNGEPILAKPASPFYKIYKKVRKHKAVSILAACCVFILLAGVIFFKSKEARERQKNLELQRKAMLRQKKIEAKALLESAWVDLEKGNLLSAQQKLNEVLKRDPSLPEAYLASARIYLKMENYPQAFQKLEKALELKPNYPEACFWIGKIFHSQKRYRQALEKYSLALKYNAEYLPALEERYKVHKKLGMLREVQKDWQLLKKLRKRNIQKKLSKAKKFMDKKKYFDALSLLEEVSKIDIKNIACYLLRARCYQHLGKYQEAIHDINKVIEFHQPRYKTLLHLAQNHPPAFEWILERAQIYFSAGRLRLAKKDYLLLSKIKPKESFLYLRLGQIFYHHHRYDKALTYLLQAQAQGLKNFELYHTLAETYLKLQSLDEGLEAAQKALDLAPKNVQALFTFAMLKYAKKNSSSYQEGLNILIQAYRLKPLDKIALEIARGYLHLNQPKKALNFLVLIQNKTAKFYFYYAKILYLRSYYKDALKAINSAIRYSSIPHGTFYELRGDIYRKLKNYKLAWEDYAAAMDMDWSLLTVFSKLLSVFLQGFLLEDGIERFWMKRDWLSAIARRAWSQEISLFVPEEEELLARYYYSEKIGEQKKRLTTENFKEAIESLGSDNPEIQNMAKKHLVSLGYSILPQLKKEVENNVGQIRQLLQEVITTIESSFEEKEKRNLLRYLVRIYIRRDLLAKKLLVHYGKRRFSLLKLILRDKSLPLLLRFYAAKELYNTSDKNTIAYLKNLVNSPTAEGVLAAISISQSIGSTKEVREAILRGISSPDFTLASIALSELEVSKENLPKIQRLLEETKDDRIQLIAAAKLFLFNENPKALNILKKNLMSKNPVAKMYVCQILAESLNPKSIPLLLGIFRKKGNQYLEKNPDVRLAAVMAMRVFRHPKIEKLLIQLLKDPDMRVRAHSIIILSRIKSLPAIQSLIQVARNTNEILYLRVLALFSFRYIQNQWLMIQFFMSDLPQLVKDPVPLMRSLVIFALALLAYHHPNQASYVEKYITNGLNDDSPWVQTSAAMGIGMMRKDQYLEHLWTLLKTNRNNMLGAASATAIVMINYFKNRNNPQNLFANLKSYPPIVKKGAAHGLWQVLRSREGKIQKKINRQAVEKLLQSVQYLYPHYQSYISLAQQYAAWRQKSKALYFLRKALKIAPMNISVIRTAGEIYRLFRLFKQAHKIYDKWIELYPNDYLPYYYKATISSGEEKIKYYRYALLALAHPSTGREYEIKVRILEFFGLSKKRNLTLERGVRETNDTNLYYLKIKDLMSKNLYKDALHYIKLYETSVSTLPSFIKRSRGICFRYLGKYRKALTDFYSLSRRYRYSLNTLVHIAYCEEKLGNLQKAYGILYNLYKRYPNRGFILSAMGLYYQRRGKKYYPKAANYFLKAARYDSAYAPKAYALLSINYALRNNRGKCVEYIQKASDHGFEDYNWLQTIEGYQTSLKIEGFRIKVEK